MSVPVFIAPSRIVFIPDTPKPVTLTSRRADVAASSGLSPDQSVAPDVSGYLSLSQIRQFSLCPLQWWLARRYAPAFVPVSLAFGCGFHAALATFFWGRAGGTVVTVDALMSAFERGVRMDTVDKGLPIRFNTRIPDFAAMFGLARRMLATPLSSYPQGEVVAVEEDFSLRLAGDLPLLRGRIDLMEIHTDADGVRRLHVVDFKTVSRKPAWEDLDVDQLLLYAQAARSMKKAASTGLPLTLEIVSVTKTKTKTPEVVTIPVNPVPRQVRRLTEKIRQCHAAMRTGHCYPAPGPHCATCGYSTRCAAWPALPSPLPLPLPDSA